MMSRFTKSWTVGKGRSLPYGRMRAWAHGLLLVAFLLFMVARLEPFVWSGWPWLKAFADAALVGALADWFAVVSLFRHPLGLPIWHTAIVPRNQHRIAASLARFVHDKMVSPETVLTQLQSYQAGKKMAQWLALEANQHRASLVLQQHLGALLAQLPHLAWQLPLIQLLKRQIEGQSQARLQQACQRMWPTLRASAHYPIFLQALLNEAQTLLNHAELAPRLAAELRTVLFEKHPTFARVLSSMLNTEEYSLDMVNSLKNKGLTVLSEMQNTPNHPLTLALEAWLAKNMTALAGQESTALTLKQGVLNYLDQASFSRVLDDILHQSQAALASEQGARLLQNGLRHVADQLQHSPEWQEKISAQVCVWLAYGLEDGREMLSAHIQRTLQNWDQAQLIQELEQLFGADLQSIRINGTLVGGLLGLVLHAV